MLESIAVLGIPSLTPATRSGIQALSKARVIYIDAVNTQTTKPQVQGMKQDDSVVPVGEPRGVDCLLVSMLVHVDAALLRSYPSLTYVCVFGPELGMVDVAEAQKRGITVTGLCVPTATKSTAHFALAQMLAVARSRLGDNETLSKMTLGVVGLGAVGSELATMAAVLGMNVVFFTKDEAPVFTQQSDDGSDSGKHTADTHTRSPADGSNVSKNAGDVNTPHTRCESLSELLAASHFVSLHTPAHLRVLQREHFKHLRADAVIVNTAVGAVIDYAAFKEWVDNRSGAAASRTAAIFDSIATQQLQEHLDPAWITSHAQPDPLAVPRPTDQASIAAAKGGTLVVSVRAACVGEQTLNQMQDALVTTVTDFLSSREARGKRRKK